MFFDFGDKLEKTACFWEGKAFSYAQLNSQIEELRKKLPNKRVLGLLHCKNDLSTLVAYLCCLRYELPIILVDPNSAQKTVEHIKKSYVLGFVIEGNCVEILSSDAPDMSPELAILLSTSGSTGSPKQVALSYKNLQSNSESICQYLPIVSTDITITTLPFAYSYGLSIVNTHLLSGAAIVLNEFSVMEKGFWQLMKTHEVTSLGGVPYTYTMLKRLGFFRKPMPSLRYLTQAGGKMKAALIAEAAEFANTNDAELFVMYGQTEATARIAYLAPVKALTKPDAIGTAIPGCVLSIFDTDGRQVLSPYKEGELVLKGNNIMLGYVTGSEQLGDLVAPEHLRTGDIAYVDAEGDFHITGRLKRIVKVNGMRISLDEIEKLAGELGFEVLVCGEDNKICIAVKKDPNDQQIQTKISQQLGVHPSFIHLKVVESFPVLENGKIDYGAIRAEFNDS